MKPSPFFQAFQSMKSSRIKGLKFFYAAIFFFYVLIACKFFSPDFQREGLKQFHLKTDSFAQWALMQIVPSMYNYENQCQIGGYSTWVNHFPLRTITFINDREEFYKVGIGIPIKLESVYQQQRLESNYFIQEEEGRLVIQELPK